MQSSASDRCHGALTAFHRLFMLTCTQACMTLVLHKLPMSWPMLSNVVPGQDAKRLLEGSGCSPLSTSGGSNGEGRAEERMGMG